MKHRYLTIDLYYLDYKMWKQNRRNGAASQGRHHGGKKDASRKKHICCSRLQIYLECAGC